MSKVTKARSKDKRRREKKARKLANYIRFGPKEKARNVKSKQRLKHSTGKPRPAVNKPLTSPKGRARRRKNGAEWRVGGRNKRKS